LTQQTYLHHVYMHDGVVSATWFLQRIIWWYA